MAISQVTSVNQDELDGIRPQMLEYMRSCLPTSGLAMLFVMLTNIIDEATELVYIGQGTAELVRAAFQKECGPAWSAAKSSWFPRCSLRLSIPWLQSHSIRYREPSIPNDRAT